jgi:hypothetical protein
MVDGLTDHMIGDHVDHQIHAAFVQGRRKVLEIICGAISRVQAVAARQSRMIRIMFENCIGAHISCCQYP